MSTGAAISLLLGCGERFVAVAAVHNDGVIPGLLDEASVHQLRHQVSCQLTRLDILLQLHHLLLEGTDLRFLGLSHGLLLSSSLLVSLDLCLGAASLGADFQHVGGHALCHWMVKEMGQQRGGACTYERHEWRM